MLIPRYRRGTETQGVRWRPQGCPACRWQNPASARLTDSPWVWIREVEGRAVQPGTWVPWDYQARSPGGWEGYHLRVRNPRRPDALSPGSPWSPEEPGGLATVGADSATQMILMDKNNRWESQGPGRLLVRAGHEGGDQPRWVKGQTGARRESAGPEQGHKDLTPTALDLRTGSPAPGSVL